MNNRLRIRVFMGVVAPVLGFFCVGLWLLAKGSAWIPAWVLVMGVMLLGAPLVMPAPSKPKVSASRTPLERLKEDYAGREDPDWEEFERKVARLMKPARTPDHRYSDEDIRVQKMRTRREIREIHARNRKERGW